MLDPPILTSLVVESFQALVNVPYLTQASGKATAAGDGASASTQSTATLSAVAASRALGGGCTEVEVTGLRMHYAGAPIPLRVRGHAANRASQVVPPPPFTCS